MWRGVTGSVPMAGRHGSYRFVLRPKWLIGHLIIIATAVAFVNLGFWQLRRLDEKRTRNSMIEQRMHQPTTPLAALIGPTVAVDDPKIETIVNRRVRVTGHYDPAAEVLVRSRSLNGQAGYHVLTPLIEHGDLAVLINRGWVPGPDIKRTAPAGSVTVTGLVLATQRRGSIGPTDPATGVLREIARSDIERVRHQYRGDLYPIIVQAENTEPAPSLDMPTVLPPPAQDEGNHLSYALQWFSFTAIAILGWMALLRRTASTEAKNEN